MVLQPSVGGAKQKGDDADYSLNFVDNKKKYDLAYWVFLLYDRIFLAVFPTYTTASFTTTEQRSERGGSGKPVK